VALQGVLLNLVPSRLFVRVPVYIQGGLFAGCVLALLQSWSIKNWTALPSFAAWAPPVWFAGLNRVLLGTPDPFLHEMASRPLIASATVVGLAAVTYALAYRRCRRMLVESSERIAPPHRREWTILDLLSRDPRQRAVMQFMSKTMARSRAHRTVWLAYVGFAVAIVLNSSLIDGAFLVQKKQSWTNTVQFMVLFWPLACSCILLPGMKHVMRIPSELAANWVFRLHESEGRRQWMIAAERFAMAYALGRREHRFGVYRSARNPSPDRHRHDRGGEPLRTFVCCIWNRIPRRMVETSFDAPGGHLRGQTDV